jgi:hypothetical protein
VLTLGALATAVAAIIALVPKSSPNSTVSAELTGILVDPNTSLDQYEARYAVLPGRARTSLSSYSSGSRWSYRFVDTTTPLPAGTAPSTLPQTSPTTSTQNSPTTSTGERSTTPQQGATSTSTAPPPQLFHRFSPAEVESVAHAAMAVSPRDNNALEDLVSHTANGCLTPFNGQPCPPASEIEHELQRGVSADVAAHRVAKAFVNSRSEIIGHKIHPVGATVHFRLHLVGFQGKVATLVWSLFSEGATRPLPPEWFRSVVAMQFKADVPNDTFEGKFWMPEPKASGRYIVDLTVVDDQGITRGEARSRPFP